MSTQSFCPNCGVQVPGSEKTNNELHCLSCNHVFEVQIKKQINRKTSRINKNTSRIKRNQRNKKSTEVVRTTSRIEARKVKPEVSRYTKVWVGCAIVGS